MSIETLTGDQFMHFDAATHRDALGLYQDAIAVLTKEAAGLAGNDPNGDLSDCLDKLTSYLTLRKLHKVRLEELEEEENEPAGNSAAGQYEYNQRHPELVS